MKYHVVAIIQYIAVKTNCNHTVRRNLMVAGVIVNLHGGVTKAIAQMKKIKPSRDLFVGTRLFHDGLPSMHESGPGEQAKG